MRGEQPWRTRRAQSLRSQVPNAERVLWNELRDRRLGGFKFIRQASIDSFFVDFLCREARVVVEVDGATHGSDAEIAADEERDAVLAAQGYRVFRVRNCDVFQNMPGVLDALLALLGETLPPSPRLRGEDVTK